MRFLVKILKKDLLKESQEIKVFIEKNKTLPNFSTINSKQYNNYTITYLISKVIYNIKQNDVTLKNINRYNISFSSSTNNLKIMKKDYLDMIKRFIDYCEANSRVPAYISHKGYKIDYELFSYCVAKIGNFYLANNVLPNYCMFNSNDLKKKASTSTKKAETFNGIYVSKPHLTTSEAGLGQNTSYNCGPNAVQQAMKKLLNITIKESVLASKMGTTSAGTGHPGIESGIMWCGKTYNADFKIQWKYYSDMGKTTEEKLKNIGKLIDKSNTAIIWHIGYQDSGVNYGSNYSIFGHYEMLDKININTKFVRVLNSLGNRKSNGGYFGHLQDRKYAAQDYYAKHTPGNQKALCIITREK